MKIYYSGVGENKDFLRILDMFKIEHEQINMPQGCPDWVINPKYFDMQPNELILTPQPESDCMVELKWSRSDFIQSYESHHIHEQILYGLSHSKHMALGIVKTPWTYRDNPQVMDKKYRGMKNAIWADFQIPIIEEDNPESLVHTLKGYLEKSIEEGREIITEHQLPPVYNHVDAGQDEKTLLSTESNIRSLMCINGMGPERARTIIYQCKHIGGLVSALKRYDLQVDDIGPKMMVAMIDYFSTIGLITKDDVGNMPIEFLIDSIKPPASDRKLLRKTCDTIGESLDIAVSDDTRLAINAWLDRQ
jgi:ERCC4-type nuclease